MSGALLSFFFVGTIVKVVRLMKAAPLQPRLCPAGGSLCKLAGALDLSYLVVWLLTSSGVRLSWSSSEIWISCLSGKSVGVVLQC